MFQVVWPEDASDDPEMSFLEKDWRDPGTGGQRGMSMRSLTDEIVRLAIALTDDGQGQKLRASSILLHAHAGQGIDSGRLHLRRERFQHFEEYEDIGHFVGTYADRRQPFPFALDHQVRSQEFGFGDLTHGN